MKTYKMNINGEKYKAKIVNYDGTIATVNVNGVDFQVELEHELKDTTPKLVRSSTTIPDATKILQSNENKTNEVKAPVSGPIIKIFVKKGQKIKMGEQLLTIEAMKMENPIYAPCDSTIEEVCMKEGEQANEGSLLLKLTPSEKTVNIENTVKQTKINNNDIKKSNGTENIIAPMAGVVLDIHVKTGDKVNENDLIVTLEAMKMENPIYSHIAGTVKSIKINKGDNVQDSDILVEIGE